MRNRVGYGLLAVVMALVGVESVAFAGGYEYPGNGTRAVGRGDAFLARADDPMAGLLNPAGLGSLSGTQLLINSHVTLQRHCIQRWADTNADPTTGGTGAPGQYTASLGATGVQWPRVCNDKGFSPVPSFALAFRVTDKLGVALAIYPPQSYKTIRYGARKAQLPAPDGSTLPRRGFYTAPNGITTNFKGANGDSLLPSPVRYGLIDFDLIVLYPTIAFGYKLTDWLQVGAAFSLGFANLKFATDGQLAGGGGNEATDIMILARPRDQFVPRATASVHFMPGDNWDIVGFYRYDGTIKATGNIYNFASPTLSTSDGGGENPISGKIRFEAPRPMWFGGGIRYAKRTTPRSGDVGVKDGRVHDPMLNETFDIEVDVHYELNSQVDYFKVDTFNLTPSRSGTLLDQLTVSPTGVRLQHGWDDQISVRVGGDWNVKPGKLALRLGGTYETEGFKKGFSTVDFLPLQRFGIHGGLTWRLNQVDFSLAYARFFHTTRKVTESKVFGTAVNFDGSAIPTDQLHPIGAGEYDSKIQVFSAGVTMHID